MAKKIDGMKIGAVAMIDALGFRGIWTRAKSVNDVFESMKMIESAVHMHANRLKKHIEPKRFPKSVRSLAKSPGVTIRFLSDTIVIAAYVEPPQRKTRTNLEAQYREESGLSYEQRVEAMTGLLRYIASSCVCEALRMATAMPNPLAYRGVVSCGQFAIEGNFIVGPAVDEAAGLMEIADAGVVWLAPSAASAPNSLRISEEPAWENLVVRTRVPLKSGRELRAHVLSPFAFCEEAEAEHVRRKMLGTMSGTSIDVVIKRQNTARVLDVLLRHKEARSKAQQRVNYEVVVNGRKNKEGTVAAGTPDPSPQEEADAELDVLSNDRSPVERR